MDGGPASRILPDFARFCKTRQDFARFCKRQRSACAPATQRGDDVACGTREALVIVCSQPNTKLATYALRIPRLSPSVPTQSLPTTLQTLAIQSHPPNATSSPSPRATLGSSSDFFDRQLPPIARSSCRLLPRRHHDALLHSGEFCPSRLTIYCVLRVKEGGPAQLTRTRSSFFSSWRWGCSCSFSSLFPTQPSERSSRT